MYFSYPAPHNFSAKVDKAVPVRRNWGRKRCFMEAKDGFLPRG